MCTTIFFPFIIYKHIYHDGWNLYYQDGWHNMVKTCISVAWNEWMSPVDVLMPRMYMDGGCWAGLMHAGIPLVKMGWTLCLWLWEWGTGAYIVLDTLRPSQNGWHLPDTICEWIFFFENYCFRLKFHWRLFPRVQLIISQCCARQATNHCLNQ